jgi:hypothetical protein
MKFLVVVIVEVFRLNITRFSRQAGAVLAHFALRSGGTMIAVKRTNENSE